MARYDTILFDLDGTLVDSNRAHAECWSEASSAHGYAKPVEFFLPLIGMGDDFIFPLIDENLEAQSETAKKISQAGRTIFAERYIAQLKPFPGARALLEACRDAGLKCAVATSASESEAKKLLMIADIEDLVETVASSADAAQAKPASDIIDAALRKAGADAARSLLVGDTLYDIEAGRRAGVDTAALRCGGSAEERLRDAIAIFDGPEDMRRNLEHILK